MVDLHLVPINQVNGTDVPKAFQNSLEKSFNQYVKNQLDAKRVASNLARELPSGFVRKEFTLLGNTFNVTREGMVQDKGILNVNQVQELIEKTAPLLHPAVVERANESLFKVYSIVTDWYLVPVSSRLMLGGLSAYAGYKQGVLGLRSFVVGNYVDGCIHSMAALWSGYRCADQMLNLSGKLSVADVLLETTSIFISSQWMKIKKLFVYSKTLKKGAEAACVLVSFTLSKTLDIEKEELCLQESQDSVGISSEVNPWLGNDQDLEILLQVLMVDWD